MFDLKHDPKPLKAALAEYDRTAPARSSLWDAAQTNADVQAAEKAEKEALEKVQEAFYQVTSDRNSRENCAHVSLDFAREVAEFS